MRVLHISTSATGGAGTAAIRASDALNGIGVESHLVHIYKGNQSSNKTLHPIHRTRTEMLRSRLLTFVQRKLLQKSSNLLTPLSINLDEIFEIIDDFDVVHLHSTFNVLNLHGLGKILKQREVFVTLHDQRWFTGGCHYANECNQYINACLNCPQGTKIGKKFVKANFREALTVIGSSSRITYISPSRWLALQAKESRLLDSKPIHVLHNPIPANCTTSRTNVGIHSRMKESSKRRIGFIAEDLQNPLKGLNVLLEAWKYLSVEVSNKLELILIGKNPPKIDSLPANTSVYSAQSSDAMNTLLSEIDLLVVPSLQDNSPNVIGEAYALGRKVVGSNVGGIPEIITSLTGDVFESGNAAALAKIIENFDYKYSHAPILDYFNNEFGYTQYARRMVQIYSGNHPGLEFIS